VLVGWPGSVSVGLEFFVDIAESSGVSNCIFVLLSKVSTLAKYCFLIFCVSFSSWSLDSSDSELSPSTPVVVSAAGFPRRIISLCVLETSEMRNRIAHAKFGGKWLHNYWKRRILKN